MSKRKFYKTVIQVEVLSEEPYKYESLSDVSFDICEGNCSGTVNSIEENIVLSSKEAAKELKKQGSDPEFFQLDKDGNNLE